MSLEKLIDRAFWALTIAVCTYGVSQMQQATQSINELNAKMAVVIEKIAVQTKSVEDHELRLRKLERH